MMLDYSEAMLRLQQQTRECYGLLLKQKTGQAAQTANQMVISARVVAALLEELHQKEGASIRSRSQKIPPSSGVD